jgi:hypothetical protein
MAVSDDLILWHAVYGLEVRYWHEVDCNGAAWKTVRSLRTTRHLISNLWVEAIGDREARAFGVISFYDGSGRAPVPESNAPVMVADLLNVCVLEDGAWRFKSHRLRPVFMGAEVPLSMAVDLTR